jgi:DnaK suppressor protein
MLRKLRKTKAPSTDTSSVKPAQNPAQKATTKAPSAPAQPKPAAKASAKPAKVAKETAKESARPATKSAPARTAAKAGKAQTKPVAKAAAPKAAAKGGREREEFLARQRDLLLEERANYLRSADTLKAQADSLALEHEPGDVQFDEEGGEGGTANVDRELDLVLSAQARAAAAEIDRALAKIEVGTYGLCEQCGEPIPEARLQALPQAALCVSCKSGGLSSRR